MHRIFIVDDEPEIIDVVTEYFSAERFQINGATDGRTALESIAKEQPELVLLDIMMPEMDGYEVARRLKSDPRTAGIQIIYLSGKDRQDDNMQFSRHSGELFIHKPISLPELKEAVLCMIDSTRNVGR